MLSTIPRSNNPRDRYVPELRASINPNLQQGRSDDLYKLLLHFGAKILESDLYIKMMSGTCT
ncbi:hypothetical protein BHM03_00026308, partial [Ensete ventricosum]